MKVFLRDEVIVLIMLYSKLCKRLYRCLLTELVNNSSRMRVWNILVESYPCKNMCICRVDLMSRHSTS